MLNEGVSCPQEKIVTAAACALIKAIIEINNHEVVRKVYFIFFS
jgi:hypothetical protein